VITVRLATLQDTHAITAIHCSQVEQWARLGQEGVSAPYESLSLYERWLYGGAWMSVETCAVHLNHLLAGAGIPLVAEIDGEVLAVAEVIESFEPLPFGHHLELSNLVTHQRHRGRGLATALLQYIINMARLMKCLKVIVSHAEAGEFYQKIGFNHAQDGFGLRLPTQMGRVFYQSADVTDQSRSQIKGLHMQLGRYRSSHQEWDRLFPQVWAAGVPELLGVNVALVRFEITGGGMALVHLREATEIDCQPGDAHLACWSARPLTPSLISAIRDWASRKGYQTLVSFAASSDLPLVGAEYSTTYRQSLYEYVL
jgi:GNAT superfamily N-acetyltransferase